MLLPESFTAETAAEWGHVHRVVEQDQVLREAHLQTLPGGTEDHREAAEAFLAKRPPVFTGR